uniref:Uncharacterized protein n=1 Tax=Oryza barthii TaxID=65489 RepID=A0A0D3GD91_9ORYZ
MSPPPHPPSAPPIRSPFHRLLLRPPPRPPVPPIRRPRQGAVLPAYVAYSDTAALRSPNPYDNKSGNGASADCAFHLLDEIGLRQRRTPASSRAPRRSLTLLARAHCSPCWTLRPRMAFRPTWRARCSSGCCALDGGEWCCPGQPDMVTYLMMISGLRSAGQVAEALGE